MKRPQPGGWRALSVAAIFSAIALAVGGVSDHDFLASWAMMTVPLWVVIGGAERLAYEAGLKDGADIWRHKSAESAE